MWRVVWMSCCVGESLVSLVFGVVGDAQQCSLTLCFAHGGTEQRASPPAE